MLRNAIAVRILAYEAKICLVLLDANLRGVCYYGSEAISVASARTVDQSDRRCAAGHCCCWYGLGNGVGYLKMAAAMNKSTFSFRHYLAAIGASNVATGLHTVLYPWLIVGVLEESPSDLGLAQMALLLPNLLFILPGGVISDGRHRGSWLAFLYILYTIPLAVLFWAVYWGHLSTALVIGFGVLFGTITAFVQPARESLLAYTDTTVMHQSVAKVLVIKFIAQGLGFMLAGLLGYIDLSNLVVIQMVMFIVTALLIRRSHPRISEATELPNSDRDHWAELQEGLALFRNDRRLLHLLYLVFATGVLPFGIFLVGIPILAHQVYDGGAALLATLQILFTLGVVAANWGVMRQVKPFAFPGRSMIVSFFWRGSLFAVTALSASFWLLFPTIFLWGFSSGLSMVLGRTILHNQVAKSHRARAVSVYQLCLCGGTPVGAWFCGASIEEFGVTGAFVGIAIATMVVAASAILWSPLWDLAADDSEAVDVKTP